MSAVLFIAKTLKATGPSRTPDNWSKTERLEAPTRAFKNVSFNAHCRSFH